MLVIPAIRFINYFIPLFAEEDFPEPPGLTIPEPDYQEDDQRNGASPLGSPKIIRPRPESPNHKGLYEADAIGPRKLQNPCLDSRERINLHKELLLNQKL